MMSDCKYSWKNISRSVKKGRKNETILKIKKFDGSSQPPCFWVMTKEIKGTMCVARRWGCFYKQFQPTFEFCEYGGQKPINTKLNGSKDKLALM